jgi:hypothetical protein
MKRRAEIEPAWATPARRAARVAPAALAMAMMLASPVAAQSVPDIERAAADAIRTLDLQLDLPREPEPPSWHITLPPELEETILVCGVLVLLYLLLTNFSMDLVPAWRRRRGQE